MASSRQPAAQLALHFEPAPPTETLAWLQELPRTAPASATTTLDLARLETPLGPMLAGATTEGLCLLEFTERQQLDVELLDLTRQLGAVQTARPNAHLTRTRQELAEYFGGTRRSFTVPLHTPGSAFQQQVWQELTRIPYGHTRSYGQQAQAMHKPEAVRAVAAANGQNRVAIIIPCHRVIGADGKLTGYAGGLWRKQRLLQLEHQHAPTPPGGQMALF